MKEVTTYLMFDGNCRQAMQFYEKCFGGKLHLMPFSEMPGDKTPPEAKDRIMHACLAKEKPVLMASDVMPGTPFQKGDNFSVSVHCESAAEVDKLFGALGESGKATLPPQDMFWGAYFGMLTDQFGINWMFNFDKPK